MAKRTETPTSEVLQFFCRTRFMRLEEPKAFEEGQKPRWEATFILDPADVKGQTGIKLLLTTAARMGKETYGVVPLAIKKLAAKFIPGTKPVDLNDPANQDDGIKVAFLDGDLDRFKDYAGYAGMFIVPAHNAKLKPDVVNRKGLRVVEGQPQYPYDGCYAMGSITIWLQVGLTQQKYGKRVGLNLRGVQFHSDGEAFTQDKIENEFKALEDEEGDTPAAASDFD